MSPDFWNILSLARRLYAQALEEAAVPYGLTRMELNILLFLDRHPDLDTAADIIERQGLSKSHVSLAAADLARRGFLRRIISRGDRRRVHLAVQPAAGEAVAAGRAAQERFFARLTRGLEPEEIRSVERGLARMARTLEEMPF